MLQLICVVVYAWSFMHLPATFLSLPHLLLPSLFVLLHCAVSLPGLCIIYVVAESFGVVLQKWQQLKNGNQQQVQGTVFHGSQTQNVLR